MRSGSYVLLLLLCSCPGGVGDHDAAPATSNIARGAPNAVGADYPPATSAIPAPVPTQPPQGLPPDIADPFEPAPPPSAKADPGTQL